MYAPFPVLEHPPWSLIYGGTLAAAVRSRLQSSAPPALVELYISDKCALKCKHCFHGDVHSKSEGLTLAEWQNCILQFVSLGTRRFHFAGREPFLSTDLIPLLRWLGPLKERYGLTLGAISDGFSSAPLSGQLLECGLDYLDVSVDGLSEDHEKLRGKGTYRRTMQALDLLMQFLPNVCVSVASVIHPVNVPRITPFISELYERGVRRFFFQPVQPLGYARESLALSATMLRNCVLQLRHEIERGSLAAKGLTVMVLFPAGYLPEAVAGDAWLESCLDENLRLGRCSAQLGGNRLILEFEIMRIPFLSHLIVSHDGYMLARCGFHSVHDYDLLAPGNVRTQSVPDLLAKARAMTLSVVDSSNAPSSPVNGALPVLH
jgi:MoaA/NifB/PqqE/SkfB family radical SAM enzyme